MTERIVEKHNLEKLILFLGKQRKSEEQIADLLKRVYGLDTPLKTIGDVLSENESKSN